MAASRYGVALARTAAQRLQVHPDTPATESWKSWALREEKPRAVDLFCGCGGLSLGLERAGYRVVLSVDHDAWALESHRHNFAGPALDLDLGEPERVRSLTGLLEGVPIDLVAAGPPCQPFSRAGRSKIRSLVKQGSRSAKDQRGELWRSFLDVVCAVRPAAAVMENVPDMALGDDLATLRYMTAVLESEGYEVHSALLDAWRYGVPQHRQRLIMVALRDGGSFEWPKERAEVTLRDAIGDLPNLRDTTGELQMRARKPKTAFQKRARRGMGRNSGVVWDHITRPVRDDDRKAFELMDSGTRYNELPKRYRRYRSDIFNDKYNRLGWDELCRSITAHIAKDGYWYIHPSENRTLTVREAARVQTFPDWFRFAGSRSYAYQQIGNAVPPALAEVIGEAVLRTSAAQPVPQRMRRSARIGEIRERAVAWLRRHRRTRPWLYPGDPWRVLVGAVLGERGRRDDLVVEALAEFPSPARVTPVRVRRFGRGRPEPVKRRLTKLARAAKTIRDGADWGDRAWARAGGVGAREVELVRAVGLKEDTVLSTTQALRVVARLSGHEKPMSRLTDGKMALGAVVGSGRQVPVVNAALTAIGTSLCTAGKPDCTSCPLSACCASCRNG